jgi:hypothetical protein
MFELLHFYSGKRVQSCYYLFFSLKDLIMLAIALCLYSECLYPVALYVLAKKCRQVSVTDFYFLFPRSEANERQS